jgi:hypothetical protein
MEPGCQIGAIEKPAGQEQNWLYYHSYALNNPLLYTDPSGWEPEHETREPVSPMPYLTEYVHPYDDWGRDWFSNAAYDPYGSFARAFYTGVRQRNMEAGPTFDDLFVRGADGDWYRRDWLEDQLADAPTFYGTGALEAAVNYYNSRLPKNYFTDYYSDQDAWDYKLTASSDPEDKGLEKQQIEGLTGLSVGFGIASLCVLGTEAAPFVLGVTTIAGGAITIILFYDYIDQDYVPFKNATREEKTRTMNNFIYLIGGLNPYTPIPAAVASYCDSQGKMKWLYRFEIKITDTVTKNH